MNALQIIPPRPVTGARRPALPFRVSDAILLLALVGGMSMLSSHEGTSSEPGAAVVAEDSRDKGGGNDLIMPPAGVSASATTEDSGTGSRDEKISASAQPIALSATPASADASNDPKVLREAREPAGAEAKSDTAVRAKIGDRNVHDRDTGSVLAKLSVTSSAAAASKNDRVPRPEDARVRKTARDAIAARSAEPARRANQPRSEASYRSRKAADGSPVRAYPSPTTYGSGAEASGPYMAVPADAMKRQDWMSSAMTGTWERVVDAPGVVLNGGRQALYRILDSVW